MIIMQQNVHRKSSMLNKHSNDNKHVVVILDSMKTILMVYATKCPTLQVKNAEKLQTMKARLDVNFGMQ